MMSSTCRNDSRRRREFIDGGGQVQSEGECVSVCEGECVRGCECRRASACGRRSWGDDLGILSRGTSTVACCSARRFSPLD